MHTSTHTLPLLPCLSLSFSLSLSYQAHKNKLSEQSSQSDFFLCTLEGVLDYENFTHLIDKENKRTRTSEEPKSVIKNNDLFSISLSNSDWKAEIASLFNSGFIIITAAADISSNSKIMFK